MELSSPDYDKCMLEQSLLLEIADPRDRLMYLRPMNIFNMVGLFMYLLSGSDALSDIEFYNPLARKFVDEETTSKTLRGNWGTRLFATAALPRAIEQYRQNPQTRRAYVPVFSEDDIGYPSRNIPCLAGIQLVSSHDDLHLFATMRSQAAWGVMPYDLFLLTMLHEYIALKTESKLGSYTHFAPLTGIREDEVPKINNYLKKWTTTHVRARMEPMDMLVPGQKSLLLLCERQIRKDGRWPDEVKKLPKYWQSLLKITCARWHVKKDPYGASWRVVLQGAQDAFPMGIFVLSSI